MAPHSKNSDNGNLSAAQNAITLCNLTLWTDPVNQITDCLPGWTIVWNGTQTKEANYAFIATDPTGEIYALAIRGSIVGSKFTDWDIFSNWILEDFNVLGQTPWKYATTPNPRISNGASIAFQNVLNMQDSKSTLTIAEYLMTNAIKRNKKVIITGHSLGGNIANVYTSYFISTLTTAKLSADNVSLYTFAAPAAGNGDFASDLDAKLPTAWHYQNDNDIIPNFPVGGKVMKIGANYNPKPAASAITIGFKGNTMTLQDAFIALGGILLLYGYKQLTNNYTTFPTAITGKLDSTVQNWFAQAFAQHQPSNYAQYLDTKLKTEPAPQHV